MIRLILVRHGRTGANVSGALDTHWPGLPLDEVGCAQAESLAVRWLEEVATPPNLVLVSPLRRTRTTAAPLISRFSAPSRVEWGIREIRSGDIEMSPGDLTGALYHGTVASWIVGEWDTRMPGGENAREILGRALPPIAEALAELGSKSAGQDRVLAVVVHGALIRLLTTAMSVGEAGPLVQAQFMNNTGTTTFQVPTEVVAAIESALHADGPAAAGQCLLRALQLQTWNDAPVL